MLWLLSPTHCVFADKIYEFNLVHKPRKRIVVLVRCFVTSDRNVTLQNRQRTGG